MHGMERREPQLPPERTLDFDFLGSDRRQLDFAARTDPSTRLRFPFQSFAQVLEAFDASSVVVLCVSVPCPYVIVDFEGIGRRGLFGNRIEE